MTVALPRASVFTVCQVARAIIACTLRETARFQVGTLALEIVIAVHGTAERNENDGGNQGFGEVHFDVLN